MVSAKRRQQLRQQVKPWNDHVAKVKAANPNLEYKEVLRKAKRSYKRGRSGTINVRTSKFSVEVRPKNRSLKNAKKIAKRSKGSKRSKRSKRSRGWLW